MQLCVERLGERENVREKGIFIGLLTKSSTNDIDGAHSAFHSSDPVVITLYSEKITLDCK
jgi:hypothetical protein